MSPEEKEKLKCKIIERRKSINETTEGLESIYSTGEGKQAIVDWLKGVSDGLDEALEVLARHD